MIYIKNNTEIQTIFIPRTELQKEAYIASTKTYEDGYKDGFGEGKQYQKDQLLNLYVTENGEYEREDGWGVVTVDIPIEECPDCPEGGDCNLGEGEIYLTASDAGTYEMYASDDGYDGWSKFIVTLEGGGAIKIHKASDLLVIFNNGENIDYGTYYYVGGKITNITEVSTQYGNATYTLDNGFSVYRGKWMNGETFTSEDQIKVGAYIVVYGVIADYNGTLQFNAGSKVIAYQECEGGDLNIDAVSTSLGVGEGWTRTAAQYGLDGISQITIDGRGNNYWQKASEIVQLTQYQNPRGYNGYALGAEKYVWVINGYVADIDTDVEIWVKPEEYNRNWGGYFGSQSKDDAPDSFQIRKNDFNNGFLFQFGTEVYAYDFNPNTWYRLRMNRYGVWVNGEQKHSWDIQEYTPNGFPLTINGINNPEWANMTDLFRSNRAEYGYIYFHNLGVLVVPYNNGTFIGNGLNGQIYGRSEDGQLWYSQYYEGFGEGGSGNCDDAYNNGYSDGYGNGYNDGQNSVECPEGGECNLISPIIFSESEGNSVNAESVEIPTFVYEGNQYYNVWVLYMADYYDFKIQIRFQPTNGGYEEPVNIFGCEDADWDNTTFGARIYEGQIYFRMSGEDRLCPYTESAWYDVEMGYNSSKKWVIVNGETLWETDHTSFNKPSQNFMIGAINSGGNAFRPFYGKIAAAYVEANGNQVWLLPKDEGYMDVYWNDRTAPWIQISGENNARFEKDSMSGDGMKTITWLGKRVVCPTVQDEALLYDTIAFTYKVDGWTSAHIEKGNMTNDCDDSPLDCLLIRNRYGECTVMTKLDTCSGIVRLGNGWCNDNTIISLISKTITKFSSNSINSYHLKSIDTGMAQLEENAIMNCNSLTDIKVAILNDDLSYQFAANCFNGLPTEGTITIGKNVDVTLTDDEITSFFRTIVGEGWTITIE